MNGRGRTIARGAAATVAALAFVLPAGAVEIQELVGRWSSQDHDECQYADDSEGAPLQIRIEGDETLIGNYGWLCGVKTWNKDGDFLVGHAEACGQEGGEETFDESFALGLNSKGELLMAKDATGGLRRCPAVAE